MLQSTFYPKSKDRPTIVCLHGFLGSYLDWVPLIDSIDHSFLLINLPGHSGSILSDAIIRAPYASTSHLLLQTIRKVTHGPVIMLGYSLGARIALDLASRYPFLVSKLILESYNPGIDHYFERKKRRFIDSKWAKRFNENYSRALDQWYQQDLFKSLRNHPSYLTLYRARLLQDPLLMSTIIQLFSPGSVRNQYFQLNKLSIPIHLITGSLDTKYLQIATKLQTQYTHISHENLSDCGHNAHLENPALFSSCIHSLLNKY